MARTVHRASLFFNLALLCGLLSGIILLYMRRGNERRAMRKASKLAARRKSSSMAESLAFVKADEVDFEGLRPPAHPTVDYYVSTTNIPVVTDSIDKSSSSSAYQYRPESHPVEQAAKPVKCRHRWTKYLAQNSPKPNEKLEELLKRYIRLHDKHTRELGFEEALRLPLHSRANKIKYLVWMPHEDGGLAGQMLSLVSAFLFAILTDRVLLADFPPEIEHVFCEPFPNSSWLLPEDLKFALKAAPKAMLAVKQREPVRMAKLSLERGDMTDDKHLLSCHGTLKAVFGHIQWLVIQADYDFTQTIASNRAHQNQLNQLFGLLSQESGNTGGSIYAPLHRFLLHPSNFLWEKLTSQYHIYYSDQDPRPLRIAIHPAGVGEHQKHAELLRKVLHATGKDWVQASVYSIPAHFGLTWIDQDELRDQDESPIIEHVTFGSSANASNNPSPFINEWRRFVMDVWMVSWSMHYFLPQTIPTAALPGLLLRGSLEGVWLLADQLDRKHFADPYPLPSFNITADTVDCSLIRRK